MSAFLGKIHYLLYNKIQLNEDLLEEILKFAEVKDTETEEIKNRIYEKYGYPERRTLEEIIDQDNIHGWLQGKIDSVEYRTATIVTELINNYGIKIDDISNIYYDNGKKIMISLGTDTYKLSPKDLFMLIFEYMLEGMPCDRINEVINDSKDEFSWQTTRCIHKDYWEAADGNISNFYTLRASWIKGFIDASGTNYSYTRTENAHNIIK